MVCSLLFQSKKFRLDTVSNSAWTLLLKDWLLLWHNGESRHSEPEHAVVASQWPVNTWAIATQHPGNTWAIATQWPVSSNDAVFSTQSIPRPYNGDQWNKSNYKSKPYVKSLIRDSKIILQYSWMKSMVNCKQRAIKMGGRTIYRPLSSKRIPFQTGIDRWSHLRKVPRRRWISHTYPMWLWGYSLFKILSPWPVY
jgi:hypothetical protein